MCEEKVAFWTKGYDQTLTMGVKLLAVVGINVQKRATGRERAGRRWKGKNHPPGGTVTFTHVAVSSCLAASPKRSRLGQSATDSVNT